MSVAFRNVVGSADIPVAEWPYEALVSAIERGTLKDWIPLIRAVRKSPWGVVARQIEQYLSYESPYGVGPLLTSEIDHARTDAEQRERTEVARTVRSLVDASGMSKAEFARLVGTSRSRLSTYCNGTVVPSAAMLLRMERAATEQHR